MSSIIPFEDSAAALVAVPSYLKAAAAKVNAEVYTPPTFPVLSIKGKNFTIVKGQQKKLLTRPDDPDATVQSLHLVAIRANTQARTYYSAKFDNENSDGAVPDCFSNDGQTPDAHCREPQCKTCALCPHAVWGTKDSENGKGTACSPVTRLAVTDPDMRAEPMLLRVPPASRKAFAAVVDVAKQRGVPYNALALKVSFDKESPTPKLEFKPIGFLAEDVYAKVGDAFDSQSIKDIVGWVEPKDAEKPQADVSDDDLDSALGDSKAVAPKKTKAQPKVDDDGVIDLSVGDDEPAVQAAEEVEAPKTKPRSRAKPKVVESDDAGLLDALDSFLGGGTDD